MDWSSNSLIILIGSRNAYLKYMRKTRKYTVAIVIGIIILLIAGIGIVRERQLHSSKEGDVFVTHLRTDMLENPIGIDNVSPTFSWRMESERRGAAQSAYRIIVECASDSFDTQNTVVWDSGKVEGSISAGISYEGIKLEPQKKYAWSVSVWDELGDKITSSGAFFETGLMNTGMGDAKWITASENINRNVEWSGDDYCYEIRYEMQVIDNSGYFVFGAQDGMYGPMILCRIENQDDATIWEVITRNANAALNVGEDEMDITDICDNSAEGSYQIDLKIDYTSLVASVNGREIGTFEIPATPLASVGYYKDRRSGYFYLDNIQITDASENIVCNEDFSDDDTIFSPYYVTIENGRLRCGSGMVLTKGTDTPAPLFRRTFELDEDVQNVASARLYLTALGTLETSVNGKSVSDEVFAPGKLAYRQQLAYVTYDVTELLEQGDNALGIELFHGWYNRGVGYPEIWNPWGDTNALKGMLEIQYVDGSTQKIVTNDEFQCYTDGPVREDDLYQGEFYDATRKQVGYDTVMYDADHWNHAEVATDVEDTYNSVSMVGRESEPIRIVQTLKPISITEPVRGTYVYDFGQNFTGTVRIHLPANSAEDVITLRYGEERNAEDLSNTDDDSGTIWTENLLTANATDYYVPRADGTEEIYMPSSVFHGFRYLQITGINEQLNEEQVEGIVLSSDLERTGTFTSSDELLNAYYNNTYYSQISNFLDNPMDCPQRDERHGWAGDAQIFSETAMYNAEAYSFYKKYLDELCLLQTEDGAFPDMAPRNFGTDSSGENGAGGNNCWGDAAVAIAWNLYRFYGDTTVMSEHFDCLCKWVDYLEATSEAYVRYDGAYGDHLGQEDTPKEVTNTAWCAHSADLVSKMAAVIGHDEEATYYSNIAAKYRQAWQENFITALPADENSGVMEVMTTCDTQTSYALGLAFGLFPEDMISGAAARLDLLAQYSGYHVKTGYSGIAYLLPAFAQNGYEDTAYRMLLQREYPSLLWPAVNGATTNPEKLTSYRYEENESQSMRILDGSLNHYAYGSPVSWIYSGVLGIQPEEEDPGFRQFTLKPYTTERLSYADGSYESVYGEIHSRWEQTESGYTYTLTIPANTTATLILPQGEYFEGDVALEDAEGVTAKGEVEDSIRLTSSPNMTDGAADQKMVKFELTAGTYVIH